MKKKLLVFHPVIAPYRIDLFNHLSAIYDMELFMFHRNLIDQKFNYEKLSESFLFTPKVLDEFYNIPFLKIRKGIFKALRQTNPDIVCVSECGYVSLAVILYKKIFKKNFRVISIIDDSYDMLTNNNQFTKRHEWAEKILIPLFDDIITVEPKVRDFFQRKYNKGIYFPIIGDEKRMRESYDKSLYISEKYIEQYNLKNKKVLLFVGRLVPIKNVELVIKTLNKLKLKNVIFIIVGSGENEKKLKSITADNTNIIFTGRLEGDPLFAWYNIAECFVLPSVQEAFGAVTNEALVGGCLGLISKKAGSSSLIEEGINGYTFDPYNPTDFESKLCKCIDRSRPRNSPLILRQNRMTNNFEYYFNQLIAKL
mgnify:CR=1 FL=1